MLIYLEFFLLANLLLTSYLILYLQGGQAVHLVPVHAVDRLQPQLALLQVALVEELVRDEASHLRSSTLMNSASFCDFYEHAKQCESTSRFCLLPFFLPSFL